MRKNLILKLIITIFFVGVGVSGGISYLMYKSIVENPLVDTGEKTISINADKGTFSGVLADNKDSFKSNIFIKLYNKLNKVSISVKKGAYEIPYNSSLTEIIEYLETGKYNTSIVNVTIPEGYTIDKIAEVLESKDIISKKDFLDACENYNCPSYVKIDKNKRYNLEGYLFPDTYRLEKGMSGKTIIDIMINRFEEVISQIKKENNINISDSELEKIVIKASMIERETRKHEEKALVSSVIDNRLDINMKLQIDATVLYAMGEHKDKLYLSDLKYKSPYNTYYIQGLPIGAISNPGKESLKAAMLPEKTNYIYYMTKDGYNHKFFSNYNDFIKYKNS